MRLPAIALAIALLGVSALAGRASDSMRATPRTAPGAASLLGGFSALAVQVLWMRADQAVMDRREDDALLAFEAINDLEPQLVSSGDFIARALGFNMAEGHSDPAVRWSLARQGWRALCRTVEMNPGEARAYAARARYALLRLQPDLPMRAGFVRDVDRAGPLEFALKDAEEALRLRPQWIEPWQSAGLAAMGRGRELIASGRFDEAAARFRRAAETLGHVAGRWRADGDPELAGAIETNTENATLAEALAGICGLEAGRRESEYEDLRGLAPETRLPDLPKR